MKIADISLYQINYLIGLLPEINQAILQYLLLFIRKVQEHTVTNKMDASALATVLAPNILRPRRETASTLMGENSFVTKTMLLLLENPGQIQFKVGIVFLRFLLIASTDTISRT